MVDDDLLWCADRGNLEKVKFLLDSGTHFSQPVLGWALCHSAENGHIQVVRFLLNHGVSVDTMDAYPLTMSLRNGHMGVARLLLDHGARVTAQETFIVLKYLQESHRDKCYRLIARYWPDVFRSKDKNVYFLKTFGLLKRHCHTLHELCRKQILLAVYLHDEIVETIDTQDAIKLVNQVFYNI
jgi:hypothetical protein